MNHSAMPTGGRRIGLAALCSLALVGGLTFVSSPAHADTTSFTPDQESALRTQMSSVGIDPLIQTSLLEKVSEGILPDSSQPNAVPVDSFEQVTTTERQTVRVFADGSRTISSSDLAVTPLPTHGGITTQGATGKSGCSYSGGWYNNCKIGISDWFSSASFIIDYQTSTAGKAKVRDLRNARCDNTVGGCSVSAGIKRASQSSAGPAWGELTYHADIIHVGSGATGAFGIRVSGTNVSLY